MSDQVRVTWLGHAAFQLESGDWNILIDPFISGDPAAEGASISADSLNPTHIILTHGHGDHLGDTEAIARRSGAQVITTFECANYLKDQGLEKVADLGVGGSREFDFGRVKFTIAFHSSSAPDGTYLGAPAGVLIWLGGTCIHHAGDTALSYEMKLVGEMNDIDLALLPIGDNYTMGVDDAIKAVEFLKPEVTIPMHYNTFPVIEADPKRFGTGVEKIGRTAVIIQPGESYMLNGS